MHSVIQKHYSKRVKKSLVSVLTLNLKYILVVEVSHGQGLPLKKLDRLVSLQSHHHTSLISVLSDTPSNSFCNSREESLPMLLLQLTVLAVSFRICFRKDIRSAKTNKEKLAISRWKLHNISFLLYNFNVLIKLCRFIVNLW